MERYEPRHYMDFNWQMCYANAEFDLDWFESCLGRQQVCALTGEYLKYKDDPVAAYIQDYWKALGVTREFYPCDLEQTKNRRQAHHYTVLRPANLAGGKLPVVYFCHGGGQDAFDAEAYGMGELIPQERFYYVCANQYGPEECKRILAEMRARGDAIDESRIYVMGFSGGSGSAAEIALAMPGSIAGVVLIPGPNAFNQMNTQALARTAGPQVPTLCIGGSCDGSDRWPLVDDVSYGNFNFWMRYIAQAPNFADVFRESALQRMQTSPSAVQRRFGMAFDREYINDVDDTFCCVGDYLNADGAAVARFCSVEKMPHGVFPMFLGLGWEFVKKFRRGGAGELICEMPGMDFRTRRGEKK